MHQESDSLPEYFGDGIEEINMNNLMFTLGNCGYGDPPSYSSLCTPHVFTPTAPPPYRDVYNSEETGVLSTQL